MGSLSEDVQEQAEPKLRVLPSLPSGEPPHEAGVAARLWRDSIDLAHSSLTDPFVVQLRDGTLPRSTFHQYISQDIHYLHAYADVYKALMALFAQEHAHVVPQLALVLGRVEAEIEAHTKVVGEGAARSPHMLPSTEAYISFLRDLHTRPDADPAHIVCGVVPCSRLYGWIGKQILLDIDAQGHPYEGWITTYGSGEYQDWPPVIEAILDLIHDPDGYEELLRIYREAMRLEQEFFGAQLRYGPASVPVP